MSSLRQWFGEKSFVMQLIILSAVCDTFGAALGYALHPVIGVDPVIGIALGVVVGNFPLSAFVLQHVQSNAESDAESESDDEWGTDDW